MEISVDPTVFSAMQVGIPYKTYKKTILGRVEVQYLDPFKRLPASTILKGDPTKNDEGCFIDVWSEQEDVFFKKANLALIKSGQIIQFDRSKLSGEPEINPYHVMSDEEIIEILNKPFFTLQQALNKITAEAPLVRILELAEKEEKSSKILNIIKGRLAEVQENNLSGE